MSENPSRREVRATPSFWADLDRQLRDEAGPGGMPPSRSDFLTYDVIQIVEKFAVGWDDLPTAIPGRDDYRVLISVGRLVPAISVVGQLAPDGAVELVELDIDTEPLL